jgi:hypothetical protein
MAEWTSYKPVAETKGRLRLYLNDPAILEQMSMNGSMHLKVPIEIDGKMVVAKTKDGKFHWFFTHDNPDFIPVFVDLESSKLQKIP